MKSSRSNLPQIGRERGLMLTKCDGSLCYQTVSGFDHVDSKSIREVDRESLAA